MLWSSWYPSDVHRIPSVGDVVTYRDRPRPYTVTGRVVDRLGNVLLSLRHGQEQIHRERLEVLDWYPQIGDKVAVHKQRYCDWQASLNGKARIEQIVPDWAYSTLLLVSVQDGVATLQDGDGAEYAVPMDCVRVDRAVERDEGENEANKTQLSLGI